MRKSTDAGKTWTHIGLEKSFFISMVAVDSAIERGRTPAIDFLNGEVVERARLHGMSAPVNARVFELVHAIARGERAPSRGLLYELYDHTWQTRARGPASNRVDAAS